MIETSKNLLKSDGELYYYSSFFSKDESDLIFCALRDEIAWQSHSIHIFGKKVPQPRLMDWQGEKSYEYSGLLLKPKEFHKIIDSIRLKVQSFSAVTFNSALINYYRDGSDSMGWHRDNEKELGHRPVIASVSFGAIRRFDLREYNNNANKVKLELANGSLVIMKGSTQTYWEHSIAKTKKVHDGRINITFRNII